MHRFFSWALVGSVLVASGLGARAEDTATKTKATRADLAAAFLAFERTLRAHPVTGPEAIRVSDAFDRATMGFFLGKTGSVAEDLDALTLSLLPAAGRPAGLRTALAAKVAIEPPVFLSGSSPAPRVKAGALYRVDEAVPVPLRLRLVGEDGSPAHEQDLVFDATEGVPLGDGKDLPPPGAYRLEIVLPDGPPVAKGRWAVVARPLDLVRAENEARLSRAGAANAALADAVASCRARSALLSDRPGQVESVDLLLSGPDLAAEVEGELQALEAGRNPYAGRKGDLWRAVPYGERALRWRQFVPPEDAEGKPLPLVVALHGMGGDENLFFEGYGAGLLVDLAKERRFVLVAPRAPDLAFDPGALERIVAVIRAEQEVDPARVYLLGHSMGAGMTTLFATRRPDLVRAACAIAGAGGAPKDLKVPLLVVVGGRDGIAGRGGPPAPAAEGEGGREVRVFPEQGHTLVVPAALPGAVDWLLAH